MHASVSTWQPKKHQLSRFDSVGFSPAPLLTLRKASYAQWIMRFVLLFGSLYEFGLDTAFTVDVCEIWKKTNKSILWVLSALPHSSAVSVLLSLSVYICTEVIVTEGRLYIQIHVYNTHRTGKQGTVTWECYLMCGLSFNNIYNLSNPNIHSLNGLAASRLALLYYKIAWL